MSRPHHDGSPGVDLLDHPLPPEVGVIGLPELDVGPQAAKQVQLQVSSSAHQVDGRNHPRHPEVGEAQPAPESEDQPLLGRAVPPEAGPLGQVAQRARTTVAGPAVGVVQQHPAHVGVFETEDDPDPLPDSANSRASSHVVRLLISARYFMIFPGRLSESAPTSRSFRR